MSGEKRAGSSARVLGRAPYAAVMRVVSLRKKEPSGVQKEMGGAGLLRDKSRKSGERGLAASLSGFEEAFPGPESCHSRRRRELRHARADGGSDAATTSDVISSARCEAGRKGRGGLTQSDASARASVKCLFVRTM